jgi:hypothetical protein
MLSLNKPFSNVGLKEECQSRLDRAGSITRTTTFNSKAPMLSLLAIQYSFNPLVCLCKILRLALSVASIKALMKRKLLLTLLIFSMLSATRSVAQPGLSPDKTDLIEILVKVLHLSTKPKPSGKNKISFSVIPTTSSNGGKTIFVSAINAAFIIGNNDSTNFSSVFFLPYTNFSDNIGFGIKQNLFTNHNTWNLPGEMRISRIAQFTYGLGSNTTEKDKVDLNYTNFRVYLNANRKLSQGYFAGFGLDYDNYYDINSTASPTGSNAFTNHGIGTGTSSSVVGVNFNLLHDNRKNSINPNGGWYSAMIYRVNPSAINFSEWASIYLDLRKYFRLNSQMRKIIAVSGFYWGTDGNVPYLNLPGTQLEFTGRSGRGYALGRFRGKAMMYLEGEYRFDISRNGLWGGVIFTNLQSFSNTGGEFTSINPAAGVGARIKFNKESETNLTLDFGFGQNSFSFNIGLGEFF